MKTYSTPGIGYSFFAQLGRDLTDERVTPEHIRGSAQEAACRFAAEHPEAVTIEMKETGPGIFEPMDVVVNI
jgi:hypothetical protein